MRHRYPDSEESHGAPPPGDLTRMLRDLGSGEPAAFDRVFPLVYDQLRSLAGWHLSGERADHTLQPTALVHEAYLKLSKLEHFELEDRRHFLLVASQAMRRILIDHARTRKRAKRGGERDRIELDEGMLVADASPLDLLALDAALDRLAERSARKARVVELLYFAGLTLAEAAEVLEVSLDTVKADWRMSRIWLRAELGG